MDVFLLRSVMSGLLLFMCVTSEFITVVPSLNQISRPDSRPDIPTPPIPALGGGKTDRGKHTGHKKPHRTFAWVDTQDRRDNHEYGYAWWDDMLGTQQWYVPGEPETADVIFSPSCRGEKDNCKHWDYTTTDDAGNTIPVLMTDFPHAKVADRSCVNVISKDGLYECFNKYQEDSTYRSLLSTLQSPALLPKMMDWYPLSHSLTGDESIEAFKRDALLQDRDTQWFMKPAGKNKGQGRGMEVCNSVEEVLQLLQSTGGEYVVQRLINSYQANGNRMDLRLHFLITQMEPLKMYFSREGSISRLANGQAEGNQKFLSNFHVHNDPDLLWTFPDLEHYMQIEDAENGTHLYHRLHTFTLPRIYAIVELLFTVQDMWAHRNNSFTIMAVDFIIDEDLVPWFLECNGNANGMTAKHTGGYLRYMDMVRHALYLGTNKAFGPHSAAFPQYGSPITQPSWERIV